MTIQIITPPVADQTDSLEGGLVSLTEAIAALDSSKVAHGFLGGEFGYGARFENDCFMMHPFCWCDKPDCLWCCIWLSNEVDCTEDQAEDHRRKHKEQVRTKYGDWASRAPNFWHKASGLQVRWYKWIGRDMEIHEPATPFNVQAIFSECLESLKAVGDEG